jgi:hypothetical protein
MNDVVRALATAAGILTPVVVLMIIVSIVTVRRGEGGMHGLGHDEPHPVAVPAGAPAPAAKAGKAAGPVVEEINVGLILLFGLGLFTLTVLALLGLSLVEHMN